MGRFLGRLSENPLPFNTIRNTILGDMKMPLQEKCKRLREFEDVCRRRGLPLTIQRRTIVEEIAGRKDHPTAEQVFDAVQDRIPGVSRTTVYRVLNMLVRLGIINKIYDPGAAARFDPGTHPHHHFACLQCNRVIDLEDERLDAIALPDVAGQGFEITESHVYFRGTCASCRARIADAAAPTARAVKRSRTKRTERATSTPPPKRRRSKP